MRRAKAKDRPAPKRPERETGVWEPYDSATSIALHFGAHYRVTVHEWIHDKGKRFATAAPFFSTVELGPVEEDIEEHKRKAVGMVYEILADMVADLEKAIDAQGGG